MQAWEGQMNLTRKTAVGVATLVHAICLAAGDARCEQEAQMPREFLAGTWTLISLYDEREDGTSLSTFGTGSNGRFMLDARGSFSMQIVAPPHRQMSSGRETSTVGDKAEVHGVLAYFGTSSVDELDHTLTLHIEHGLNQTWDQSDWKASYQLIGDKLELTSTLVSSPTGSFYSHSVWRRVR
jgi:hypothetical protein